LSTFFLISVKAEMEMIHTSHFTASFTEFVSARGDRGDPEIQEIQEIQEILRLWRSAKF